MESYQRLIDVIALENLQMRAEYWVLTQVLVLSTLWQITAVLVAFAIGVLAARLPKAWLGARVRGLHVSNRVALGVIGAALSVMSPLLTLIVVLAEIVVARSFDWPTLLLSTTANLLVAWIFIRLLSGLIRNTYWSRAIAVAAFAVATFNIVGLLEPTIVRLDRLGVRGPGELACAQSTCGETGDCRDQRRQRTGRCIAGRLHGGAFVLRQPRHHFGDQLGLGGE